MLEIATEKELALVARALVGKQALTAAERKLTSSAKVADSRVVRAATALILAGEDPLGECFLALRTPAVRRAAGAVYTPWAIVDLMVRWAASKGTPIRVIDPGCGSGRFTIAAAKAFPKARLLACDIDPLAVLVLRANASVLGFAHRLDAHVVEYRFLDIPPIEGRTLYIGNPPYVRHHQISGAAKEWFAKTAAELGFKASRLAGLHVHFFLRTREVAKLGDWGAFITAAEWMDVNYGSIVRQMLSDGLGGSSLHVFRPEGSPFENAMTTGVITTFIVGERPKQLTVRQLGCASDLNDLRGGRRISWLEAAQCDRWSTLTQPRREAPKDMVRLGDLFRVHRGAVTGANDIFIDHAGLDRHVERGHRLVEDQHLGPQRQRAGDADALPLAAGELVRVPVAVLGVEADGAQQVSRPSAAGLVAAVQAVDAQRLGDDLVDRHPRVERGERVLEDDLQVAPQRPHRPRRTAR